MSGQNYCVVGGCLISLTLCRFSSQILPRMDTPTILKFSHDSLTCLWRWNRVFRNVGI